MPAQIVEVGHELFTALLRNLHSVRPALWEAGFDTPRLWRDASPTCILIEAGVTRYGLGHRPVLQDSVVALAIVEAGTAPGIWPRPLPDSATERLLDAFEPIVCSIDGLSAHARVAIAAAFHAARQAPTIAAEALVLLPPQTKRERKLRMHGLRLTRAFRAELSELDAHVSRYGDSVCQADLQECVAALSSCSELGIRLRLRPSDGSGDSVASLLTVSRRSSLEALMESVAGLSDATLHALASHAPHSPQQNAITTVDSLAYIQSIVTDAAHRQTRNPWRSYDSGDPAAARRASHESPVPSVAVMKGVNRWIQHSDRRRWVSCHPLVAAAILHLEFVRLRPFEVGTRRVGRILFQSHLHAAGWPALPWSVAFEWRHDDYLAALEESLRRRSYEPILQFVVGACRIALAKGEVIVPAMRQERERLVTALSTDPDIGSENAQLYAEALLSSIFLEGFGSARGLQNNRSALQRLHAAGAIDRIRTPIGAVYSVHLCRELMKARPSGDGVVAQSG
jgi:Fic/DOC family